MDAYTGTKPGRPVLALLIAAIALVAMLGLAWWQVGGSRALADEVAVADGALYFRPPVGWKSLDAPGAFALEPSADLRRAGLPFVKLLRLRYERAVGFVLDADSHDRRDVTLAGLSAVQRRDDASIALRQGTLPCERIQRIALTPRGDAIVLSLDSISGLSSGDAALLDRVAETVRLAESAEAPTVADVQAAIGLKFDADPGWTAQRAWQPQVAGGFFAGPRDSGAGWTLGLHRTCLAFDRQPSELLHDYAAQIWELPPAQIEVTRASGGGGFDVYQVWRPEDAGGHNAVAVWLVVATPSDCALIELLAPSLDDAGRSAAQRVIASLQFTATPLAFDVKAAERAGAALVDRFYDRGLRSWWDEPAHREYLIAETGGDPIVWGRQRRTLDDDAYRGVEFVSYPSVQRVERWQVDADGRTYAHDIEDIAQNRMSQRVDRYRAAEQRVTTSGPITRVATDGRREWTVDFDPPPAFVPMALAEIAHFLIAGEPDGRWIHTTSMQRGSGAFCLFVQPLPAEKGRQRVLLQYDFHPQGMVATFDEAGGFVRFELPSLDFQRAPAEAVERRFPEFRALWYEWLEEPPARPRLRRQSASK